MTPVAEKTQRRFRVNRTRRKPQRRPLPPLLENGDHLSRQEFERRYEAMPELKKAELLKGSVYMPSPVHRSHSKAHAEIMAWLGQYWSLTPGIEVNDNATVRLDDDTEVQPDAALRVVSQTAGTSTLSPDDYIEGPPELIVEIAGSSASFDLYEKRDVYQRSGVQEYLVWQLYEQRLDWWHLTEGAYTALEPDEQDVLQSRVFPGLHLSAGDLLSGNLAGVLTTLQHGVHTDAHAAFVQALEEQTS
jgi:Uma2 family endonuclease